MPSIPQMGSVWDDWGKTEAALIKGGRPGRRVDQDGRLDQAKLG
jgi:arabinogalactan oligomer/maltooligosaccharide transport system substrate-binding protein